MNFPCFRAISLSFVSFLATAVGAVAQQLPEKEEDIPVEFIPRLENTVSIGFSRLSSGPRVRFGNLGMIGNAATQSSSTLGTATRVYANGTVSQDSLNSYEKDLNGNALTTLYSQFETAGWKSKVTADGVITVYTPVSIAQTDAAGNPIRNSDGTYVPVSSPNDSGNPDGSSNPVDNPAQFWAATTRFLAYKAGQTRSWNVTNQSQINADDHTVSMSTYGATSMGVSIEADSPANNGFELSLEHRLGQRGRFEWGISGGIKLVGINAKAQAVIPAYLTSTTDVYSMVPNVGTTDQYNEVIVDGTKYVYQPSASAVNLGLYAYDPSLVSHDPTLILKYPDTNRDALRYLSAGAAPQSWTAGGDMTKVTPLNVDNVLFGTSKLDDQGRVVAVQGKWQLKGAYYMIRVGPTFRYRFNDTFSVSGSFGIVQGYVGTTFKAEEAFDDTLDVYTDATFQTNKKIPDDGTAAQVYRSKEENVTHKFVPGVYGEVNVEYWVTERTGFYFGMTKQAMRDFTQTPLSGRTAKIDMGSASGWKLGVMTRF